MKRSCVYAGLLGSMLAASPARADIVWEGRTVAAWPEQAFADEVPHPAPGLQIAQGFYPAPKGEVWGLTILVDFSDQAPAFSKAQIDAWLNQKNYREGGLNGSVRDYYADVSNGMVDLRNDTVGFYRANKPKSYYEGGSGYARADELFREVIAALDPSVDFSKYDNDGNGSTEAISIVYAGPSVTWGQGLWPHAGGSNVRADGVTLSRHMMTSLGNRLTLYTFCHEVGHMLFGWPDLYGFGDYCLMGNATDARDPAGINDFFRADQGWIEETAITRDMNVRLEATAQGGGYRYTNPADPGECFFWSNVQNDGRWHGLKGSGLLFLHYKRSLRSNDPPNPLALAVVEADGRDELGKQMWPSPGSDADDFFSAATVEELSDRTRPAARWHDGASSGLRVHDIGQSGDVMQFSVGLAAPTDDWTRADAGVPADAGSKPDAGLRSPDASTARPVDASAPMDASATEPARDAHVAPDASRETKDDAPASAEERSDGCTLGAPGAATRPFWLAVVLGLAMLRRRNERLRARNHDRC